MVTAFGKFCRKLRIDHNEILKDMAELLKVTSSFLSAVELGKKNIPEEWEKEIEISYKLNEKAKAELKKAVIASTNQVKIDLQQSSEIERDLAVSFARKFNGLSDVDIEKFRKFLNDD